MIPPYARLLADFNALLLAMLFLGLLTQRRYRLCWSFLAYVAAVFLGNRLVVTWPEIFFTRWFASLKEAVYALLKLSIAAELGLLTFSRLPRARRLFLSVIAVLTILAALAQLAPSSMPGHWARVLNPRGQASVLCLLASTIVLAAFYRVPFHPFHRSLLLGFGLYLFAYTGSLTLLKEWGPSAYPYYAALDPAAYAASLCVWILAAWRPAPALSPAGRHLQPWAEAAS